MKQLLPQNPIRPIVKVEGTRQENSKETIRVPHINLCGNTYNPVLTPDTNNAQSLYNPLNLFGSSMELPIQSLPSELQNYCIKKVISSQVNIAEQIAKSEVRVNQEEKIQEIRERKRIQREEEFKTLSYDTDGNVYLHRIDAVGKIRTVPFIINQKIKVRKLVSHGFDEEAVLVVEFDKNAARKEIFINTQKTIPSNLIDLLIRSGMTIYGSRRLNVELRDHLLALIIDVATEEEIPGRYGWYQMSDGTFKNTSTLQGTIVMEEVLTKCI